MRVKNNITKCKSCGKLITWLRTERGKQMPVDGATKDPVYNQQRHVSHWDTCPKAEDFRSKNKQPAKAARPHVIPEPMQQRLAKVRLLANKLLKQGYSPADLQELSSENTGLMRFENLHATSQQDLDRLINAFEARLNTVQGVKHVY